MFVVRFYMVKQSISEFFLVGMFENECGYVYDLGDLTENSVNSFNVMTMTQLRIYKRITLFLNRKID